MKQTFFFSHDYNARNDHKMVALHMTHGLAGIGAYWCIIEMLYEADGYLMRSHCDRIAFALRTESDSIASIIYDSELFDYDEDQFWSSSVLERLQLRADKSQKATKSAEKRWVDANAMRSHSERNAIKESKVKESKVKESKGKESKVKEIPPTAHAAEVVSKPKADTFEPTGLTAAILQRHDVAPAWDAFLQQRKKLKAPNTHYALTLIVNKLQQFRGTDGAGWAELLNLAVERGWRSVFEPNENQLNLPKQHATKPTLNERYNDAARRLLQGS